MKNIYEFVNRIIPGDCVEVMRQMPTGSVDLIATDAPYLVGYTSRDGRAIANDKTGLDHRVGHFRSLRIIV